MSKQDNASAGRNPAKGDKNTTRVKYNTEGSFGPVEKVRALALAAGISDLSRAELAVLNVLVDMINSQTGQAWPSYNTLADRTATTPRTIKRAVLKLMKREPPLVLLVAQGNRVRSNRYALNRAYFAELGAYGGSDARDTTLVTPVSSCSDAEGQKVVTPESPESIHESEHKAKDEWDRSSNDGATPDRPAGPPGLPQSGDRYPEFWEAMGGRRTTVADAEQIIAEALADGADYQEIIEGAKRYRRYCTETSGSMKSTAAAWLRRQAWRDGWELPTERADIALSRSGKAGDKAKAKKSDKEHFTKTGKPKRRMRLEYKIWKDKNTRLMRRCSDVRKTLTTHVKTCHTCKGAASREQCCDGGKDLVDAFRAVKSTYEEWREENKPPNCWEVWSHEANNWVMGE